MSDNKLYQANSMLASVLKKMGINKFVFTSLGNSIGSGYSVVRRTMPLLLRNNTLDDAMKLQGIDTEIHHFARAQNNNDEHVVEWLESNIKESDIHKMNLGDYSEGLASMGKTSLTEEEKQEYYPTDIVGDKGLSDIIMDTAEKKANVVIYNGGTGSFLDNLTRGGKLKNQFLFGVKRDLKNIESVLTIIQTNNRLNGGGTQVYLCGAPDFLGIKVTEIINKRLRKITKEYANVTYVEPVKSKFFYKPLENEEELSKVQSLFQKILGSPDIHYDEEEYLQFNTNIVNAIQENYAINESMINFDRNLYALSRTIETGNQGLMNNSEFLNDIVEKLISIETEKMDDEETKRFYEEAYNYVLERLPYDYFYVGKDNINEIFKNIR